VRRDRLDAIPALVRRRHDLQRDAHRDAAGADPDHDQSALDGAILACQALGMRQGCRMPGTLALVLGP
jgi:hypothetical protein